MASNATDRSVTLFVGRTNYRSATGFVWLIGSSLAAAAHMLVVFAAMAALLESDKTLQGRIFAGLLALVFGLMGLLWTWLAATCIAGVIRGGFYESAIRTDAVYVGTPFGARFGTRRYEWTSVVDLSLYRRPLFMRRDLVVTVKSGLGAGTRVVPIYTDRDISEEEFGQLYFQLTERGLLRDR